MIFAGHWQALLSGNFCSGGQSSLLETPDEELDSVLSKEGFAVEDEARHAPMAGSPVIELVLFDQAFVGVGVGGNLAIHRREVEAGASCGPGEMVALIPSLDGAVPDYF